MIKSELISSLASKIDHIPEKDVTLCINVILEHISDSISAGERVEIRGFGSFNLHYHPPRNAHNPKTGERLRTPAKYSPHFKPGKEMRERINASVSECTITDEDE